MKPFNLEAAKAGKPVCTRDGHDARIICFDRKNKHTPIVALITGLYNDSPNEESGLNYNINGKIASPVNNGLDLMMKTKKHEGWVILYQQDKQSPITTSVRIYAIKENAESVGIGTKAYIGTAKIEWED